MRDALRPPSRRRRASVRSLLHLDERATDVPTQHLLRSRRWDVVVLQAQNYSLSGTNAYPDDGSVALVREATDRGAFPVLFAEWARRDVDESSSASPPAAEADPLVGQGVEAYPGCRDSACCLRAARSSSGVRIRPWPVSIRRRRLSVT